MKEVGDWCRCHSLVFTMPLIFRAGMQYKNILWAGKLNSCFRQGYFMWLWVVGHLGVCVRQQTSLDYLCSIAIGPKMHAPTGSKRLME